MLCAPAGLGASPRGGIAPVGPIPSISGCAFWYRADVTVPNTNGSVVTQWPDMLGYAGRTLVNQLGTSPTVPTRTTSGSASWNSKPVVKPGNLANTAVLQAQAFAVALPQPLTLYCAFYEAGGTDLNNFILDGSTVSDRVLLYRSTSSVLGLYAGGTAILTGASFPQGARYLACCVLNGASSALYINASASAAASGNCGSQGLTGFTVGGKYTRNENRLGGDIPEIVGYAGAHDATQRAAHFSYYASSYSMSVS